MGTCLTCPSSRRTLCSFHEEVTMSISPRLKELLDSNGIAYEHRTHPVTYTASELADAMHVPRGEMAKTVVVNGEGLLRMTVLPADCVLNLKHLQWVTRSENMRLATESEFQQTFPDSEVGAMPPFGNLFGVPVFCDTRFESNDSIEFNDGTHTDT